MNSDCDRAARFNLRNLVRCQGVLGVLANVDVASNLGASALVDDVVVNLGITDNRGVLLAGVDRRAVTGNVRVD